MKNPTEVACEPFPAIAGCASDQPSSPANPDQTLPQKLVSATHTTTPNQHNNQSVILTTTTSATSTNTATITNLHQQPQPPSFLSSSHSSSSTIPGKPTSLRESTTDHSDQLQITPSNSEQRRSSFPAMMGSDLLRRYSGGSGYENVYGGLPNERQERGRPASSASIDSDGIQQFSEQRDSLSNSTRFDRDEHFGISSRTPQLHNGVGSFLDSLRSNTNHVVNSNEYY